MKQVAALSLTVLLVAGCIERKPLTVADFLENEAALYGTLARCEDDPAAGTDLECGNARQAAERISIIEERALRKAREEAFASAREEYRARLDRERSLRIKAESEAEDARLRALIGPLPLEESDAPPEPPADGAAEPGDGAEAPPPETSQPPPPAPEER